MNSQEFILSKLKHKIHKNGLKNTWKDMEKIYTNPYERYDVRYLFFKAMDELNINREEVFN